MPIEVKELIIKAVVDDQTSKEENKNDKKLDREEIVIDCVDQVLDILNKKLER